jgi:putative hemolysin
MLAENPVSFPFRLSQEKPENWQQRLQSTGLRGLERLLGLARCEQLYQQIDGDCPIYEFSAQALEKLGVSCASASHAAERIPAKGPVILIANHPFGGIEGLALFHLIGQIRTDFKVMGNYFLSRVPQLRDHLISVDPFAGSTAARTNIGPLRQALKCLQRGELLIIFPAGEVSSWQPRLGCVADRPWSATLARLVRLSRAPVQPVYVAGNNGLMFQLLGRLDERLRTLLLPRMMLNKKGLKLRLAIGHPLPAKRLIDRRSDREMTDYLRLRTYALAAGLEQQPAPAASVGNQHPAPLIEAVATDLLQRDLMALPAAQRLLDSGDFSVYYASADQIPALLQEIGRLREETFRHIGEGTGREVDLDSFDRDYLHLWAWDHKQQQVVGAYRIGRVDQLCAMQGPEGLYATTLFDFKPELLARLGPSLELGRSFVRLEYQRSYAPLLLLWKGIGHYLVRQPQYRYLFGPVSISSDYCKSSRQLMASSLQRHYRIVELARLVSPRCPVAVKPLKIAGIKRQQFDALLSGIDDISALVADLEQDNKGVPVLLRHYLGLGGKLLAFNLDPDFSDVIDGLLLVDLLEADQKQMQRYMGRDGYRCYRGAHQFATSA